MKDPDIKYALGLQSPKDGKRVNYAPRPPPHNFVSANKKKIKELERQKQQLLESAYEEHSGFITSGPYNEPLRVPRMA